jgi:phosphoribosyl-ATP pyrophosphohydrolase
MSTETATLDRLAGIIRERKESAPAGSYTASLFAKGVTECAKKVGEEAIEVVQASALNQEERIVYESADLIYHLLVLLAAHDIDPNDIYRELERRMKR